MAILAPDVYRKPAAVLTVIMGVLMTVARSAVAPHRASLTNLRAIPLTVAGVFCIDFAGFHLAHGWGWLITGVSFIVLEHVVADDVR